MKVLNRYLLGSFFQSFAICLTVITFVTSLGMLFKVVEVLAKFGSGGAIASLFLLRIPEALSFGIPLSVLTACLLVFGRLSADGETTAMRACGLSVFRIARAPLLAGLALMLGCFYINAELAPRAHFQRKVVTRSLERDPLRFFITGQFVSVIPDLDFYIGKKDGSNITDVIIYDHREPGVRRMIRAESGQIAVINDGRSAFLNLKGVRIDPFWNDQPGYAETYTVSGIEFNEGARGYTRRSDDYTVSDLIGRVRRIDELYPHLEGADRAAQRMYFMVALQKRFVFSVFCLGFVFLGVPLGLKAQRKESSAGIGISLCIITLCYAAVIAAETVQRRPELRPDLIMWLPVAVIFVLGGLLFAKAE